MQNQGAIVTKDPESIMTLPIEIFLLIMDKLPLKTILNVSETNRRFEYLLSERYFWLSKYKEYGLEIREQPSRANFIGKLNGYVNQLSSEIDFFLLKYKPDILHLFFEDAQKLREVMFMFKVLEKHQQSIKSFDPIIKEVNLVISKLNAAIIEKQKPAPGQNHIVIHFTTRLGDDFFQNYLLENPQTNLEAHKICHINLGQSLLKTLPPSLGEFTHCTALQLYDTQLESLPPELANLLQLRQLCISGGQFESFPEVLLNIPTLSSLCLPQMGLTEIPPALSNLRHLEVLFFHDNELEHIPRAILKLSKLNQITLNGNKLTSNEIDKVLDLLQGLNTPLLELVRSQKLPDEAPNQTALLMQFQGLRISTDCEEGESGDPSPTTPRSRHRSHY